MDQRKSISKRTFFWIFLLLLIIASLLFIYENYRPRNVNEVWKLEYSKGNLEGKVITVRGDIIFDPNSDFQFNGVFLIDSHAPIDLRTPADGFWFGISLPEVLCVVGKTDQDYICKPFDPTQAQSYQFWGVIHLRQIGEKKIMSLTNLDFDRSKLYINGRWQSISTGTFLIPVY